MTNRHVLWIDNDAAHVLPFATVLKEQGWVVAVARTLADAETQLANTPALVILDVMMPITEEDIAAGYTFDEAEDGRAAGLAFFRRHHDWFTDRQVPVMVFTVRVDSSIADKFVSAGLPPSAFVTKFEIRDRRSFLRKVASVLQGSDDHGVA